MVEILVIYLLSLPFFALVGLGALQYAIASSRAPTTTIARTTSRFLSRLPSPLNRVYLNPTDEDDIVDFVKRVTRMEGVSTMFLGAFIPIMMIILSIHRLITSPSSTLSEASVPVGIISFQAITMVYFASFGWRFQRCGRRLEQTVSHTDAIHADKRP